MHFYVFRPKETRFLELVLLITFVFRLFLAAIIYAFLQAKNTAPEIIILATSLTLILVVLDLFFTVRSFWRCEKYAIVEWIGRIYKAILIGVALGYSIAICFSISYWPYPAFGAFVAMLFILDYVIIHITHKIEIPGKIKTSIKPGVYVHYKGGRYTILGPARHSETLEPMIVYKSSKGDMWVRPEHMFHEKVLYKGKFVKRFTRVTKK